MLDGRHGIPSEVVLDISSAFARYLPLSPRDRASIERLAFATEQLPARRKIVQEGRSCRDLFLVHAGWLAGFRQLPDGGRQVFNFWLPGDVAGVEFFATRNATFSVATLTPARISRLSLDQLQELSGSAPALTSLLALLACRNGTLLRERMVGLGRRDAYCRVGHLLLELAHRQHPDGGPAIACAAFPLTQLEVADATGLTAPYVNRILRSMRESGFLALTPLGLELRDPQALAARVRFHNGYLRFPAELAGAGRPPLLSPATTA
ncbi:MAG: Crp/Fnr family transcriptional regulator [Alphaproteobacteria bacterium]|nr:Crp/Fnr family transcriptional regulator [Alphaproteobacteria bacterium]